MEVGDNFLHNLVFIAWSDDDLRAGVQGFHTMTIQVV